MPATAEWGALGYLGPMSMFGGFIFWNAELAIVGGARVAQVQLLQTFVRLAMSTTLLGEQIGLETIISAVLVAFVVWPGRKARFS